MRIKVDKTEEYLQHEQKKQKQRGRPRRAWMGEVRQTTEKREIESRKQEKECRIGKNCG